jgi:uncharacterized protein YndB with AHSA1/START domain
MSEAPPATTEAHSQGNGGSRAEPERWAAMPGSNTPPGPLPELDPRATGRVIPALHSPGARPLVRDRWERLVTTIEIPAPAQQVWQALTDPAALKLWLAVCQGSIEHTDRDCVLDFEDGEFFLCRTTSADAPHRLQYYWRWLGIGQATLVTWQLEPSNGGTRVTVTEDATNPPWDWQTWNGGGWPGILEQLAAYLRTGMEWRWPWRRMGPYAQIELPASVYECWDRLFSPYSLKYWLLSAHGSIAPGQTLPIFLGDASGMVDMTVHEVVQPGQSPPSFLPFVTYSLSRQSWGNQVGGRLWIEPAGWGRSLFQAFHYNWESLPSGLQLSERKILSGFWAGAMRRASQLFGFSDMQAAPHNWS